MACFRLVTFLPLRPLLSLPCFMAFISVSTSLLALGEYLRVDFFRDEDFFAGDRLLVDFVGIFISSAVRWRMDFRRLSILRPRSGLRPAPRAPYNSFSTSATRPASSSLGESSSPVSISSTGNARLCGRSTSRLSPIST